MREAHFQDAVIELCKKLGVAWYHPYLAHRSADGWPDLALCGPAGFMTRELKTECGKLMASQERWGSMLRAVGVDWDVWRPADLRSGRIERELRAISGMPQSAPDDRCAVCGTKLDPVLPQSGYRTHPCCDPYERPSQVITCN